MELNKKIEILIVDDDEEFIHFIKIALSHSRYNLNYFMSGSVAYNYLLKPIVKPDIVLLDYQLPNMNGIEILQRLSAQEHDYSFIFLTASDDIEIVIKAMKFGALDFIIKSTGLRNELPEKIEKVIRLNTKYT